MCVRVYGKVSVLCDWRVVLVIVIFVLFVWFVRIVLLFILSLFIWGSFMFDYVKFGVSDYVVSKVFFFKVFELLGVVIVGEGELLYGIEISVFGKFLLCLF